MPRDIAYYGWRPDLPGKDPKFAQVAKKPRLKVLPPKVDFRDKGFLPTVYDQGELGSCTANAIAAAIDYDRKRQGQEFIYPSRLAIYYGERVMENSIGDDAGAEIRDGITVVSTQGAGPESTWAYDISKFALSPSGDYYLGALATVARGSSRLNSQDITELKSCLAAGDPFVFGFTVYPEFETTAVAGSGQVPMPQGNNSLGGHAVLAVGYDDTMTIPGAPSGVFIVRNSWGADWGIHGYFYLPQAYVINPDLADDFWHISTVGYGPVQPVKD